jgi:ABC-type transport system involved in multi-copper enzyme maturation permease subunit
METSVGSFRNDISETYLSVKFELMKHLKRRRLPIVAAMAIIVPLIFYVKVPDTGGVFAANVLSFLSVLIVISAAMFAGDAVCGEFEKKTNLLLFPTPQRRSTIFVGAYVAALLATFLVVFLYYLVITLQIAQLYGWGQIPTELAKSFLTALIYSASAVSVVFFFSAILKRSISSTIVGFLFLMIVLQVLATILMRVNQEPWFVVTYSAQLIRDVLGVSSSLPFGPGEHGFDFAAFQPHFGVGIAVMLAYAIVGLLGGIFVALRRED